MRGTVMTEADVVLTVGRRLDFQLAYGSPAIFGQAHFVRIGEVPGELRDNRRGAVEILAAPAEALRALVEAAGNRFASVARSWSDGLRLSREDRARKLKQPMRMRSSSSMAAISSALPGSACLRRKCSAQGRSPASASPRASPVPIDQ